MGIIIAYNQIQRKDLRQCQEECCPFPVFIHIPIFFFLSGINILQTKDCFFSPSLQLTFETSSRLFMM